MISVGHQAGRQADRQARANNVSEASACVQSSPATLELPSLLDERVRRIGWSPLGRLPECFRKQESGTKTVRNHGGGGKGWAERWEVARRRGAWGGRS